MIGHISSSRNSDTNGYDPYARTNDVNTVTTATNANVNASSAWITITYEPLPEDLFIDFRVALKSEYRIQREIEARARVRHLRPLPERRTPAPPSLVPVLFSRAPRRGPHRSRRLLGRAHPLNRARFDNPPGYR